MSSTISAGTTLTTALVQTADTSGVLQLQTNGGTTALTLDTSQNATFAGKVASASSLQLATNGTTTAVTIDTSQNVGIGVTPYASSFTLGGSKWGIFNGNIGGVATTSNQGVMLGWNASSGGGDANIVWGTYYTGTAPLTFSSSNGSALTERMRIDSSGNSLAGTTSTSGSMSNAAAFVGGSFKTATGSFASPPTGSWTTIATVSQVGMYLVHAYIGLYNAGPGNWSNVFVVSYTGMNTAYLWNLSGAGVGDINGQIVSSNQIQIYCGAGTGPTVYWTIARFGN